MTDKFEEFVVENSDICCENYYVVRVKYEGSDQDNIYYGLGWTAIKTEKTPFGSITLGGDIFIPKDSEALTEYQAKGLLYSFLANAEKNGISPLFEAKIIKCRIECSHKLTAIGEEIV